MRKNLVVSDFYHSAMNNITTKVIEDFDRSSINAINEITKRIKTKLTKDLDYILVDEKKLWRKLPMKPLNKNHKNYKDIIKDFKGLVKKKDDWVFYHEKMFDDGYTGDYKTFIESVDMEVDVREVDSQKVFTDIVYSYIQFLNTWKEDLVEIIGGIKLGTTFSELFTWLGYVLNKWETKESNIIKLMNFFKHHKDGYIGVNLFEKNYVDYTDKDFLNYGYLRYGRKNLFVVITTKEHDGMGWKSRIESLDPDDEFPIYRAVSDLDYMLGFSWSPSINTVFDWGARNHKNKVFYIGKTHIKRKDILIWNMWSRRYGGMSFDYFCEIILPHTTLEMEKIQITKWDLNQKASVIKKRMKSYDDLVEHRRLFMDWHNDMCVAYNDSIKKRRIDDLDLYNQMPKSLLKKLWNEVSKNYDTDNLYDLIGREKEFIVDNNKLNFTEEEARWVRERVPEGFLKSFSGDFGIRMPFTISTMRPS